MPKERLEGVTAEIGVDRDGIRAVALESLGGVALGCLAHIAALGIENHRYARMLLVDVLDGALELILGLAGGVVRELRLVRAHQVGGGVDDGLVELEDRRGFGGDMPREALDVRVEPHARERVASLPGARELLDEAAHATRVRPPPLRFFRCTSRIDTATGVTPGMRPAWPRVAGRTSRSLCRTSCDRPDRSV